MGALHRRRHAGRLVLDHDPVHLQVRGTHLPRREWRRRHGAARDPVDFRRGRHGRVATGAPLESHRGARPLPPPGGEAGPHAPHPRSTRVQLRLHGLREGRCAVTPWAQPIAPVHSVGLSALVATLPLVTVLGLLGIARKSGLVAAGSGLLVAALLAAGVWRMPLNLAGWSIGFGFATAAWSILWLVFNALWLYNLSVRAGSFDRLRQWIELRASGDPCVQAVLVAFCFGALLEGSAGFGAPVAITAFLLVGVGFDPKKAVLVSLLANTAPVAFGSVGVPIVALASVTGLDVMKLGAAVGRQLPLLSVVLPAYLSLVVAGRRGLRRTWPAVVVAGVSFAATQYFVSNYWGPYATDVLSALVSIVATTTLLRVWTPAPLVLADATIRGQTPSAQPEGPHPLAP